MPMQSESFEYVELECPNCQAPLRGRAGANIVTCEFCGSQVQITRKASHSDGSIVVRDASGRALLHMMVPFDWDVSGAVLDSSVGSGEWPWQISAEITDHKGDYIRYRSPLEFVFRGPVMQQVMTSYGNPATNEAEPRTVPFEVPAMYFQNEMTRQLGNLSTTARYLGQIPLPFRAPVDTVQYEQAYASAKTQEIMSLAQGSGMQVRIEGFYARPICRLYGFSMDGQDYRIAIYANICAEKVSYPTLEGMFGMGVGSLLGGFSQIGNAFGGLFGGSQQPRSQGQGGGFMNTMVDKGLLGGMMGRKIKEQRQSQGAPTSGMPSVASQGGFPTPPVNSVQQPMQGFAPEGMADDADAEKFRQQGNADISWHLQDYFVLICPASRFDELYKGIFTDVVSNTRIDDFLMQQKDQLNMNKQQNLRVSVQQFQAQGQQTVARSMEYSRQMNAASQAQMQSWQAQSDAHHQAVLDRGHAMFSDAGGTPADKFSEYIRGENTYVDQYGDEHSVSNRWDEAWQNENGDIIGTERGVNPPGYGWTKLDRK